MTGDPENFSARLREALDRPLENWRNVYESFSPVDIETGEQLARRIPPADGNARRAAVLVPLLLDPEGIELVYTVRKGHLNDHAGQISFPGGSLEPGDDSLLNTALREAEEEIDLSRALVEVIGELEEMYIPPSNFRVSPYVGLLPHEAEFAIDPREVEEIFTAPLLDLLSPGNFQKVIWSRDGRDYEVPVFAVKGYEVWGATAAMTAALLSRLGWRPPA
ncbi:MAG: CoA pyrophosphatase [Rubrobacteraceae bacterium]